LGAVFAGFGLFLSGSGCRFFGYSEGGESMAV